MAKETNGLKIVPKAGESGKGKVGEVKIAAPVVMMIKAEDLELGPNVRGKISEEKRKRFAENIRANKIDTPLTVERKDERSKGKGYIIRDGACRFLGGQDAGLSEFPCQVREVGDVINFQLRTTFREDFGAVEEAKAFRDQLKNKTLADLVLATGKEKTYIEKRLLLLNLDTEMQQAITDGKISAGHGYVLAQVGDQKLRKDYFQGTLKKKLSVADILSDIKNSWEKSVKLDVAVFDRKECAACPFSGIKTLSLFESTDTFSGECTNPGCFAKKQAPVLEKALRQPTKYPNAKVIIRNELHVGSYGLDKEIKELKNSEEFSVYNDREVPDGCKKCEKLIVVSGFDGNAKKFCTDPACFKKKSRRGSSGGEKSEKQDPARVKEMAKTKVENRVKETRNRFLLPAAANTSQATVSAALIVAIDSICQELAWSDKDIALYLVEKGLLPEKKKNVSNGNIWGQITRLLAKPDINSATREVRMKYQTELENMLRHFAELRVKQCMGFELGELAALAGMASRSINDFRVDEEYLEKMTKDNLVALAKEWKLPDPGNTLMKKGDMVAWILKSAPDKCPAEIADLKTHPLASKHETAELEEDEEE